MGSDQGSEKAQDRIIFFYWPKELIRGTMDSKEVADWGITFETIQDTDGKVFALIPTIGDRLATDVFTKMILNFCSMLIQLEPPKDSVILEEEGKLTEEGKKYVGEKKDG